VRGDRIYAEVVPPVGIGLWWVYGAGQARAAFTERGAKRKARRLVRYAQREAAARAGAFRVYADRETQP
jgi:hypothetical protein